MLKRNGIATVDSDVQDHASPMSKDKNIITENACNKDIRWIIFGFIDSEP